MGNLVRRPKPNSKFVLKSVAKPYNPYLYIPDNFSTIEQVTQALREEGLESSNLIVGIDFTKSNEWTGLHSFGGQCLHTIGDKLNPYEETISIIGRTLAPFDEDNLIPCFGFGDATTHDQEVFSFHSNHSPCHGFEEVLACYRRIAPNLQLSGPTSFAPIIDAAVDIVDNSGGLFHVLLIIADGQISRSSDTNARVLSQQHEKTIKSIVAASSYPLSIVLVGVGDGPWDGMKEFDDKIVEREFDNFQFVNFTAIMSKKPSKSVKESTFALAALMEIPIQYKACLELGLLGRVTGKAKKVVPRPPPHHSQNQQPLQPLRGLPKFDADVRTYREVCPFCSSNVKDLALGCGHATCQECAMYLSICPICRTAILSQFELYNGR